MSVLPIESNSKSVSSEAVTLAEAATRDSSSNMIEEVESVWRKGLCTPRPDAASIAGDWEAFRLQREEMSSAQVFVEAIGGQYLWSAVSGEAIDRNRVPDPYAAAMGVALSNAVLCPNKK